jgi:hypothetical protein
MMKVVAIFALTIVAISQVCSASLLGPNSLQVHI